MEIMKYTRLEELLREYEQIQSFNQRSLDIMSIEVQFQGYRKLLEEIEREKRNLEKLERQADVLGIKNPVRTKNEIAMVKAKLLELEKSIYDAFKSFRAKEEASPTTAIQINIIASSPNNPISEEE
ncbi:DNA replication protein [uncultured virus]|uniref:DNA replication protein n=1 Tax=uncultured virus TaxID=340016 RepID=A0A5Q0TWN1_9VIRU|nr:DNA replication protein [uncultured virus]